MATYFKFINYFSALPRGLKKTVQMNKPLRSCFAFDVSSSFRHFEHNKMVFNKIPIIPIFNFIPFPSLAFRWIDGRFLYIESSTVFSKLRFCILICQMFFKLNNFFNRLFLVYFKKKPWRYFNMLIVKINPRNNN